MHNSSCEYNNLISSHQNIYNNPLAQGQKLHIAGGCVVPTTTLVYLILHLSPWKLKKMAGFYLIKIGSLAGFAIIPSLLLSLTGDAMLCIDAMLCMIETKTTSGIQTYALSTTPENTSRYSAPNHLAIVPMLTLGIFTNMF